MLKRAVILAAVMLSAGPVMASSGDAWEEFAADVEQACRAATSGLADAKVVVDPYGSESFGLAVVTGETFGTKVSVICVYDKQTMEVEIGSELKALVQSKK